MDLSWRSGNDGRLYPSRELTFAEWSLFDDMERERARLSGFPLKRVEATPEASK